MSVRDELVVLAFLGALTGAGALLWAREGWGSGCALPFPSASEPAPVSPRDGADEIDERREGEEAQAVEGGEPEDAAGAQW